MPRHGYHPIPTAGPSADKGEAYLSAMGLAANFAVVNRLMLGTLALRCLSDAAGRTVSGKLVYDAPHNLIWSEGQDHLHRKGAPSRRMPEGISRRICLRPPMTSVCPALCPPWKRTTPCA